MEVNPDTGQSLGAAITKAASYRPETKPKSCMILSMANAIPSITPARKTTVMTAVAMKTTGNRRERQPLSLWAEDSPIQTPKKANSKARKRTAGPITGRKPKISSRWARVTHEDGIVIRCL